MPRPRRKRRYSVDAPIFRLELDLVLHFIPPMSEEGAGIRLTRTIELPFVPSEHIAVYSRTFDNCPEPMGFYPKQIIWDVDRQVFLAQTYYVCDGSAMTMIPFDLAEWLERGWQFGGYADKYQTMSADSDEDLMADIPEFFDEERLPALRPNRRSKDFNRTFKSLIRLMAELDNNCSVAYAMAKTQQYFEDSELKGESSPNAEKFATAVREYFKLSIEEQSRWKDKIRRRYPRLQRLAQKASFS